ncbi:hypothetical protein IMSHALPRED_002502 [Imshaugia aleurites]|uniref:Uncharacterized protein n=1 Tax=Imshaugia aleurites TaxID=172621 RepID=A0A8H3J5Y4_9LECA|nr:hypothetical protein IMSHALPRED_002502 [Imshaugia aleurites]
MSPNNSMVNQSLTEGDFYERPPVVFSTSPIIGTGGKYQVWLALGLASLIISAYHNSPYPIADGEITGDLPKCGGSTFIPYCTEIVAKTAWNDGDFTALWPLTRERTLAVPSQQQGTFARLTRFMTALGIFSTVTPVQESTLVEGIFAGCENIFRKGPGLPVESYATFTAGLDDVLCTAAPTPTTTVCPTMTITYPQATAPPYTTTAYVPAGDPRCRTYNPNVDWQPAGNCDAGLEWGGCPADASSNLGFYNELTGPFSDPQNVVNFMEAMEDLKAPVYVWNVTLMGPNSYCSEANVLVEAPVTSVGLTTAACQALPTQVVFGAASINSLGKGFCANFNYASDCSGGMQQFCNRGSEPASTCLRASYPNNRNPQKFKGFEIVPA